MINFSSKKNKIFFIPFTIVLFLLMCISNKTLYTNRIPDTLMLLLHLIPFFFFFFILSKNKITSNSIILILYVVIVYFQLLIKNPNNSFFRVVTTIGSIFSISSVFLLSNLDKKKLLDSITNIIIFLLLLSIAGWMLKLLGHPPPVIEHVDLNDNLHYLYNHIVYYDGDTFTLLPRFRAFFIEPGQLATPCVYLFFAREAKFKDWKNLVLLAALFLSFSLAGYVTLFIGLFLKYIFANQKFRLLKILSFILIVGTISFLTIKAANEENPLYSLVFQRLAYDEENLISGYNRTDEVFDYNFSQFLKSKKILFGMGDEIPLGESNWTNNASGIKKFLLNYGLISVICMLLLTLKLLKINFCRDSIVFFVVLWLAYIVRDLLQSQFWLIIAILGFYNLKFNSCNTNNTTNLHYQPKK